MALKTLSIADFSGGRNTKATSFALRVNETLDQWSTWTENGALVKRRGWSAISSQILGVDNRILKMSLTNLGASGANRLVMMGRIGGTTAHASYLAYTDNGTTISHCEATPTVFSGAAVPFMGMFRGKLYVSDGTNSAVSYDGTTVATVANFPKYTKCAVHKNYIFAAKGSTVYWSDINDATTWPTNNFQTVDSDVGDYIVALYSWGGNLLIFKKRSMWMLIGDVFDPIEANYTIQRINTPANFTFLSSQTIVPHMGVLKFLTVDGFYAYSGGNSVIKISDAIQPDIDTVDSTGLQVLSTEADTPDSFPKSFVWKNAMYCSVIVSGNRRIIVQDERGKWWLFVDNSFAASPLEAVSCNLGSGEKLYGGMPGYSFFLTMDTGNSLTLPAPSNPAAINGYWISKDFSFPAELMMRYAEIYLKKQTAVGGLGTLTLSFSIDGATYVDKSVDMMNGTGTILKKRIPIERIGRSIKFKVANNEVGVTFEIYNISMVYEPTGATRS